MDDRVRHLRLRIRALHQGHAASAAVTLPQTLLARDVTVAPVISCGASWDNTADRGAMFGDLPEPQPIVENPRLRRP
jgi:hypothetical protein